MDPEHAQMLTALTALGETLQRITTVLETITTCLEQTTHAAPASVDGRAVPIATYEQMYGPVASAPDVPLPVASPSPRLGRFRRFLFREG